MTSVTCSCGVVFEYSPGNGRPRTKCDGCRKHGYSRRTVGPVECAHCGSPVVARRKYCSERCKHQAAWARRNRRPCGVCGEPMGWAASDERGDGQQTHKACRPIVHGSASGYRRGCRCDDCRAWNARAARAYAEKVRERDGISPTQKARPAKGRTCAQCGSPVKSNAGRARDGLILCSKHRQEKRKSDRRKDWRHREATRRLQLAAEGVPANPANAIVQGACRQCGETFAARRAFSGLCSRRCREKMKGRGRWITDADRYAIYERDDWTCQLCFEPVDPTLHYLDNMAASLDHIECRSWTLIPDDSPRNLRLAHRLCNSMRGDESWSLAVSA